MEPPSIILPVGLADFVMSRTLVRRFRVVNRVFARTPRAGARPMKRAAPESAASLQGGNIEAPETGARTDKLWHGLVNLVLSRKYWLLAAV